MRVLFWGTPEFAAPALRALLGEGFDVVGVVTQPDRPSGRSRSAPTPPPIKLIAIEEGIPVLQPESPRGDAFRDQLRELEPDVSAVIAYGHILPRDIIDVPPLGTLNVHASLLPQLRGAAPIEAAILAGLAESGVTIFRIVPALDAGPILLTSATPIADDETAGELRLRLSELGALALVEALTLLELGQLPEEPQDDARATYAPKIGREMARINFGAPSEQVARTVRAFDPRPGAFAPMHGVDVRLYGARVADTTGGVPGEVLDVDEYGLVVACGTGAVRIADVHPAGRKRMSAHGWARGRGVQTGDRFAGTDERPQ